MCKNNLWGKIGICSLFVALFSFSSVGSLEANDQSQSDQNVEYVARGGHRGGHRGGYHHGGYRHGGGWRGSYYGYYGSPYYSYPNYYYYNSYPYYYYSYPYYYSY